MSFSQYTVKENTLVDGAGFDSSFQRKLARLSTGRIYITYVRSDGTNNQVYVSYSDNDGETWAEEQVTSTASDKENPCLVVTSEDTLCVAFQADGTYFIKKPYEGSWSAEVKIGTTASVTMAIDSNDKLWTVRASNTYSRIYVTYSINGGLDWTSLPYFTGKIFSPTSVAIDSDNNVHIVYAGGSSPYEFYYRKYDALTEIMGDPELIMATPYLGNSNSSIAIDSDDIPHTVIEQRYSTAIYAIYYANRVGGSWSNTLLSDLSYKAYRPTIAINGDGTTIHVLYYGYHAGSTSYRQIALRIYTDSWGDTQWLTSGNTNKRFPNLIWAMFPLDGSARTNIPATGCLIGYVDEDDIKVFVDSTLSWASGGIVKTFSELGSGTETLPVDKILIIKDVGNGIDNWVLPEVIVIDFPDSGIGTENLVANKLKEFADSGVGLDVFLRDWTLIFTDSGSGAEAYYKVFHYPANLKRVIILIRDRK